eukprot:COSAG01_NODE_13108_length_1634_cov_1.533550_2_plen_317_part_00
MQTPMMRLLLLAVALCHRLQHTGSPQTTPAPDLLLQLAHCDMRDVRQSWSGIPPAAAHGGSGSFTMQIGGRSRSGPSGPPALCVSEETEQPGQIVGVSAAACRQNSSSLQLRGGALVLLRTGQCLEATYERGVQGVYFLWSPCIDDALAATQAGQRFAVNVTTGLVQSTSLPGFCVRADAFELPQLLIHPGAVISHGFGDMNIAFHFAHSADLAGVCGHDSQPYHCAVQYFAGEPLVPQTPESSVPVCDGCPENMTLLYDHCKNHDFVVDVGQLPDYARGNSQIDDTSNIWNSSIYLSRAECGTYGQNSVINTWAM